MTYAAHLVTLRDHYICLVLALFGSVYEFSGGRITRILLVKLECHSVKMLFK